MANIKGIIVEIGGDTSALEKSLKNVNTSTSNLSKELRGIDTLLKFDTSNSDLLAQKQTVLNEKIGVTEEKLKTLKDAQKQADEQMKNGTNISAENYRNLEREIISTENQLKKMKVEASNWTKAGTAIDEYGKKVDSIGNKVGELGNKLTATVTTSTIALGASAIVVFNEVDEGYDTIIKKTGATGESAQNLEQIYKNVSGKVTGSFNNIGAAIGEINTRFGFTDKLLEDASVRFLEFAKINDVDVNTAVQKVSRYMGDAGIEAEKYAEVLDDLTSVGQASGIAIDSLAEYLVNYGAPMRALGLDTKESIAIFAGWEKAGVNTEIAFSGMKAAIGKWGKEGKDATEEFKKTLNEIEKCPDIATATSKAIDIFGQKAGPDLADAIKGGRFEYEDFLGVLENSQGIVEKTYDTITDETDDAEIAMKKLKTEFSEVGKEILKTAVPAVEDILGITRDLIFKFNELDDETQANIIKFVALAAAIGPVVSVGGKLISTTGQAISSMGTLVKTVGEVRSGMTVANNATGLLAKGISALASPTGLAVVGISAAMIAITVAIKQAEEETRVSMTNMASSASEYIQGISSATSYLDGFNSTLFATSEEQAELQKNMDEIQQGITSICKTAADERRDYTQQEIVQLEEYFNKLRELKDREIEIQASIAESITQQAVTQSETFKGSLEEYTVISQNWINTATQQKDATVKIIQDSTTEQIALLNQQYTTEESRRTEEYAKEYEDIMAQQQLKIDAANQEVTEVTAVYANGYSTRLINDSEFFAKVQEANVKNEEEQKRHTEELDWIEGTGIAQHNLRSNEMKLHQNNMNAIWDSMYADMSETQADQLGVWLAMQADTEMQGGKIDEESARIVKSITDSFDSMPKETQEAMKNAMEPMLTEMENKEPTLYAKATGIADGILNRLRTAFDIHSPSRETKKIFGYVMESPINEMEKGKKKLYGITDEISKGILDRFSKTNMNLDFEGIDNKITAKNQTVFTTPQITFNVQDLDDKKLEQCFNYVNRKFGSEY